MAFMWRREPPLLEKVDTLVRVAGREIPVRLAPRRPGDTPKLVARSERIRHLLGWQPQYDDLETIVRHALAWETKFRSGSARESVARPG